MLRDIEDYPTYTTIISGFRAVAEELGCLLIEVDQFWKGANSPSAKRNEETADHH